MENESIPQIPIAVFPTHEEIAKLAYDIWEHEGKADGTDKSDWRTAEKILQGETYEIHVGGIAYTVTSKVLASLFCRKDSLISLRCTSEEIAFFIEDSAGDRILAYPSKESVSLRDGFCVISCVSLYRDPLLFELDIVVIPNPHDHH